MSALVHTGYQQARDVTRHHAKSFYFASIALFGARRRAAFALYAFCRRLDDLVDSSSVHTELPERLAHARAVVSSLYGRGVRPAGPTSWPEPELAALEHTISHFHIPEQPFQDLISGMEMDLRIDRYRTFAELDLYCYRVAGVVGLMLTPVLGFSDERALEPAADLGRAMQLTNILRDVREDLQRGRIYLPAEELAAFGLREEDLRAHRVDDRFIAFMRCQIARARAYYARAATGVRYLRGFGSQRMVRMMGAIYSGILEVIEDQQYDIFRSRAYVPLRRKLRIASRTLFAPSTVLPAPAQPVEVPLLPAVRLA